MSQMLVDIKRIVNEDISNRVTQYDVIFEAITNSIHANATKIVCTLDSLDNLLKEDEVDLVTRKVDSILIWDNGDGLNEKNYSSFCKYRTEHKIDLGCKGVGRLIFLKTFKNVEFVSQLVNEQEERVFKFEFDFDTENIQITPKKVKNNSTTISLIEPTLQYLYPIRGVDRRIDLNIEDIRERVLIHLIPTLFFYKKKKKRNIQIDFYDKRNDKTVSIFKSDIPEFLAAPFLVQGKEDNKFEFTLYYKIEKNDGALNAFYCGNNRTVCEFSDQDFKLTLPYGYSGYLLLESEYLDKHVNNERNEFDIFPVRADFVSPISWEQINAQLKSVIGRIIKEGIADSEKINKEKLMNIQDERPYLINYIEEQDIDMAGFLDKKHIIEKAKKRFDVAKEKVLINAGKSEYTNNELQEAIQIAQNELVSYINDRALILERLIKLIDKKEKIEEVIHNLFMEKGTTDDYYSLGKNNLWLLDDRFTSYTYAASDKRIKDVLSDIGETSEGIDNENDEPDLSLFFSHNPNNPERLNSVLVEIKSFDYNAKPNRKKFSGIHQLRDYVKAFKVKERIEEIYAFLITDIDEKLASDLIDDNYIPLFSTESPIFHRFYDKLGISIYVVSARTLIKDAEARNRVFLDIIRKQSRLNKMLEHTNTSGVSL